MFAIIFGEFTVSPPRWFLEQSLHQFLCGHPIFLPMAQSGCVIQEYHMLLLTYQSAPASNTATKILYHTRNLILDVHHPAAVCVSPSGYVWESLGTKLHVQGIADRIVLCLPLHRGTRRCLLPGAIQVL